MFSLAVGFFVSAPLFFGMTLLALLFSLLYDRISVDSQQMAFMTTYTGFTDRVSFSVLFLSFPSMMSSPADTRRFSKQVEMVVKNSAATVSLVHIPRRLTRTDETSFPEDV